MRSQVTVVATISSLCWASAALCHAQATFEAKPMSPLEIKAELEEQKRKLAAEQAKQKKWTDTGGQLFGNNATKIDTTLDTLALKEPEEYRVGDWGLPLLSAGRSGDFREFPGRHQWP